MTRKRRSYSAAEKAAAVRQHLVDKIPVSQIAEQMKVQPTLIHGWINVVMKQAERAFETPRKAKKQSNDHEQKLAALRDKLAVKNEVISELMEENIRSKRRWGALKGRWVPPDTRDQIIDYIDYWRKRTEIMVGQLLRWIGLSTSKYHNWIRRYGKINSHNGKIPRDWWIQDWEKQAIIDYHDKHPLEGYRRLCFMMLDDDVVAVSPATVYRVLKAAGRLDRKNNGRSQKGTGFKQPLKAHQHWHVDISYINAGGTFFYLITVLDGYSRYIVHHELRESMTELDVEIVCQAALEKHPGVKPRLISDNGPQFIAKDFKAFVRHSGMTHVKTSPYYPQSNGKLERWHGSLKRETIRPNCPRNADEAKQHIDAYVRHYNEVRLHSAIGYVTPADHLAGLTPEIHAERDRKLEEARARRRANSRGDELANAT